jgi:hypothetical protein
MSTTSVSAKTWAPYPTALDSQVFAVVPLAPALQPVQQSPHSRHAPRSTLPIVRSAVYAMVAGARRKGTPRVRAVHAWASRRGRCGAVSGTVAGFITSWARCRPAIQSGSVPPRRGAGHAGSSITRGSAATMTPPLISELPPRPHPDRCPPGPGWKSNSPGPRASGRSMPTWARTSAKVRGKSPGWNSRPRSSRQTVRPERAIRFTTGAPP